MVETRACHLRMNGYMSHISNSGKWAFKIMVAVTRGRVDYEHDEGVDQQRLRGYVQEQR